MGSKAKVKRMSADLMTPCRLRVVSRFSRTILTVDEAGCLVAILTKERLGGPRSIVVDSFPDAMSWYSVGGEDADFVIDNETESFAVALPVGQPPFDVSNINMLRLFIESFAPEEALASQVRKNSMAKELINRYMGSLPQGPCPDISGFGCGLTPSSDDFLLGVLAYVDATEAMCRQAVREGIRKSLSQIAPVSRSMLECALEGKYPEIVLRYFDSRDFKSLLDFLHHGATSGLDMAFGIYSMASWLERKI